MRLRALWNRISSGLWFVPTTIVLGHAALAVILILVDQRVDTSDIDGIAWIFRGGSDSARAALSTVASSMITVMGVTFSVTIVALQLASSQYTPRVLYTFTRDRGNQVVMGSFIGTFTYAIIVLRAVRSPEDGVLFVPTIAVTGGIILALVSVAALIYFIHHISTSIRVSHIIARIARTTRPLMARPFPRQAGLPIRILPAPVPSAAARAIDAWDSGYVQMIDGNRLIDLARKENAVIFMVVGPGDYISEGTPVMLIDPPGSFDARRDGHVREAMTLGNERSMLQDPEFGVRQLMDIAVKALSPSINDPTTAITCLDYLGTLMLEVAGEEDPAPCRADEQGALRLVSRGATFESLLAHGFDQIRQHTREDVAVSIRFLTVLARIGMHVQSDERRAMIWTQARELARAASEAIPGERDRLAVNEALREVAQAVRADAAPVLLHVRS